MSTIKVNTLTTLNGSGNITVSRPFTGLSGSGASLTALNATELTSGTIPIARIADDAITNAKMADDAIGVAQLSATGTASNSVFLRGDNSWATAGSTSASDLTSGTLPDGRFPATLPAASGVNLTALNASNLASGTVATARLGSGTANNTVHLRGDGTWAAAGVTPKMKIFDTSYAFSNAPGTQTISGVGFAPDAMYGEWGTGNDTRNGPCRFWAVNRDVSSFSTGTGSYIAAWQHNEEQTAATWEFKSNYLIWEQSYNNDFRATITTWGSDGITITYTENGTGAHTSMNMMCVMFKFS